MSERRTVIPLSEEQIEEIADRAADKAVSRLHARFYQEIGQGFVSRSFTILGVVIVAAWMWLSSHGFIK